MGLRGPYALGTYGGICTQDGQKGVSAVIIVVESGN